MYWELVFMYTLAAIIIIAVSAVVYYYYMNWYNIRGQYFSVKGDGERALYYYEKAYNRKPKAANTLNYGYLLLRAGRLSEAETIINSAFMLSKITEDDKNRARMMLALISWQKGDVSEAIGIYEELLAHEENTTLYANLGFLYIESGDIEKAYDFCRRAYEYNDDNNVILDNIAECAYRSGNLSEAMEYLEKAVNSKQPIAENYYHYAKVLKDCGDREGALKYARMADSMTVNALSGIKKSDVSSLVSELENEC